MIMLTNAGASGMSSMLVTLVLMLAASFICFSRRAISFSFSALVIFTPLRPFRSAVGEEISIRSRTDLITVLGTMPWALL